MYAGNTVGIAATKFKIECLLNNEKEKRGLNIICKNAACMVVRKRNTPKRVTTQASR